MCRSATARGRVTRRRNGPWNTNVFLNERALSFGELGGAVYIVDSKRRIARVPRSASGNRSTVVAQFHDGAHFDLQNVGGTLLASPDNGTTWRVDVTGNKLVAVTPNFIAQWPYAHAPSAPSRP